MTAKVGLPDHSLIADRDTPGTYLEAGFGGGFDRGQRPAVIVVDFSLGFTDPAAPTGADMSREIDHTNQLIAAAREIGAPIVFTTIAYDEAPVDITWLRKARGMAALTKNSPLIEIDSRCDRADGDPVIVKQHASAFFGTALLSHRVSHAVDMVVVCVTRPGIGSAEVELRRDTHQGQSGCECRREVRGTVPPSSPSGSPQTPPRGGDGSFRPRTPGRGRGRQLRDRDRRVRSEQTGSLYPRRQNFSRRRHHRRRRHQFAHQDGVRRTGRDRRKRRHGLPDPQPGGPGTLRRQRCPHRRCASTIGAGTPGSPNCLTTRTSGSWPGH
jgi:hypothetical protein